mmetsp:Transcript_38169/g.52991  ORF Transcript_38169/g.52991 Transcript_38169/m.52991 type:complete len:82 (-) Transcript_38169:454-699(-)
MLNDSSVTFRNTLEDGRVSTEFFECSIVAALMGKLPFNIDRTSGDLISTNLVKFNFELPSSKAICSALEATLGFAAATLAR